MADNELDAMRALRASYWNDVRAFSEEIAREQWDALSDDDRLDMVADGELSDDLRDAINDACSEYADSSEWVIYTWRTYIVPLCSDHVDAYEDNGGLGDHDPASLDGAVQQAAYYAMREDLLECAISHAESLIVAEAAIEAEAAQNDGE